VKKAGIKKCAEDYLPWAGRFATKENDPEVYARLPGWWQREMKLIEEAVRAGRKVTAAEFEALHAGEEKVRTMRHIPDSFGLSALKSRFRTSAPVGNILYQLREVATDDNVLLNCTAFGEGRALLRRSPRHGLYAYLWTAAIYQRKVIPSMPVTALYDLEEGIHDLTGEWLSVEDAIEPLFAWVDAAVASLLSSVA